MSSVLESASLERGSRILLLVDAASLAIREVSKSTLSLLGYRRDELVGRPITDIECSLADVSFWDAVLGGGPAEANNAEGSYRCAGGGVLTATKSISRASCDDGGCLVVRADPLDSGDRIGEQLASLASVLQATLEATGDGILLVDRAGRIANMNRRFSRMWQLPGPVLAEQDDRAIFDFMARQFSDPGAYRTRLAELAPDAGGETFDILHFADGRFFERKSTPARRGARILGRVYSFNDITGRKRMELAQTQLEAQLRESQKMETIGTLAGGIAHDFNNILATILGNAELARQDMSANPMALESLEEIRKAGARARDLVQQIISFSRRQPTERKPMALAPIVEESVRLLRATLPARLALEVHIDADVPAVLADATQMQQVLINLGTNAMQAMRDGPGRIGIRLDTVMLDAAYADTHPLLHAIHARRPGRTLRLAVSDDGPGMDAFTLARIFEPFFTTKQVNEGTGLGLSVVHGIVHAHEGAITVESEPDKGSTFTLYLSAVEAPAQIPEPSRVDAHAVPLAGAEGGPRILYVDDDESLVFLVQRTLGRRGYRISGQSDQRGALETLRADPFAYDIVVTDYNMPGMSGLEVAREVRAIRADLPVAIASGFIDEALRMHAQEAGVRELIFKADALEDLCGAFARLAQTLGRRGQVLP